MAAVVSMIFKPRNAPLLASVIGLFSGVFAGFGVPIDTNLVFVILEDIGANRWAAEAQYIYTIKTYEHVYDMQFSADAYSFKPGNLVFDFIAMMLVGTGWRIVAFVLMVCLNRDKQR
ncbi:hypothetical protein HDU76_003363 [Blyttiomyces sp. JEL0837]|nr:hypothetical protein HDU76_003363 [Blyttiomyces sp. JEL0837]